MIIRVLAALAAAVLAAAPARAATITVAAWDPAVHLALVAEAAAVEDFEALGEARGEGQLGRGEVLVTAVGGFSTLGGRGTGATSGGSGVNVALRTAVKGQGNAYPDDGRWSVNSNDTFGILWEVARTAAFDWLAFVLVDPADTGRTSVAITAGGRTEIIPAGQRDGARFLVTVRFDTPVLEAAVRIGSLRGERPVTNDSFSIDGAAVGPAPAVVPLPAAGWLLGAAVAGLAAMGWRRRARIAGDRRPA